MKATGMVRPIDHLGRVVIPKEIRKNLDVVDSVDSFEIYVDENKNIILKKYQPNCIFCGEVDGIFTFKGKNVCPECAKKIAENS